MANPDPIEIAEQELAKLTERLDRIVDPGMRIDIANLAAKIEIAKRLRGIEQSLDQGMRVWIDK